MQPGDTLGRFEILAPLGAGGMGEVYLARDTGLDREVALKIVPASFVGDKDRHARFHQEAKLLAAFTHPHVATVFSIEDLDDGHFLVMELVEGEDLSARVDRGPLAAAEALEIARQIAAALEAAHAKGIVHRDLKPQNVKFAADGGIKVLDFGLAKLIADDVGADSASTNQTGGLATTWAPDTTRPGMIMGTAAYMSPEQARGLPIDRRTDIWAFGCVLFEMLTGQRAFPGETVSDTLVAVLSAEPNWEALPPGLPASITRLLRRCIRKDPHRRLHDIADARIELEDAALDENAPDGSAFAATTAESPAPSTRRIRGWIALAVVGWLAALALFMIPRLVSRPAVPPVRIQTLTHSGRDWSPAASPDGAMLAFVSDRDGTTRIWLKQLVGGNEAPLTDGPDDMPRFSPDGSQILFVRDEDGQRNLYRMGALGGQPRKLLNDVLEAEWSPRGDEVAFLRGTPVARENRVIVGVADAQTGAERLITHIDNRTTYGLRFSPDGTHVALNEASLTGNVAEDSYVDLIDVVSGAVRKLALTEWSGPYSAVAWAPDSRSFVVGQAPDVLSYVRGSTAQILHYDIGSRTHRALFWAPLRQPRGGRGFTSLAVLSADRIVLDTQTVNAELIEISLDGEGRPVTERRMTGGLGHDRQPAYSPDGRQIIFSSNRTGNIDLWLVDRGNGAARQLTDDPADDWDPAFTPDGQHLMWSSNRSGNMEVWMAAADGSGARQITTDGVDAENPTMTLDGEWIVYTSSNDANLGVWKIRPDGTDATLLLEGSILLPEVSPDGRHAMFVLFRSLHSVIQVVDVETGELVSFEIEQGNIERHQNVVFGRARWTPDGQSILFVGLDEQGRIGIYRQSFVPGQDTSATREPVAGFSGDYLTESLGVSRDGNSMVISAMFVRRTLALAEHVELSAWR